MDNGHRGAEPRHGQDPYGTPPYGRPGPWAPAPPVQRPSPTPPAGTAVPAGAAPTPPGGTPAGLPGEPLRRYDPWAAPAGPSAPPAGTPARTAQGPSAPAPGARRGVRTAAGAALIALLAGTLGGGVGVLLERNGAFSDVHLPQTTVTDRTAAPGSIAAIAESVLPGVVTLHVRGSGSAGTGTGFVLDEQGHILTNAHVVRPAGSGGTVQVTFGSGDTARARIVGMDSGYDLAVVKVSGITGLSPLPLGDSDAVRVGDPVVAIGAPFDLEGTVTAGIISATERPITAGGEDGGSDVSYVNALQTDAAINPGNSGGPLVDLDGRVVGINSAIRAPELGRGLPDGQGDSAPGSIGLGFAIPVNQGKLIAEQLINTGRATHPVIGVTLDMRYEGGARVASSTDDPPVVPGGPGDEAGIEDGDIITAVNGERVRSGEELIVRIRSHRPGEELRLTVERDGEPRTLTVTLGEASGG
ncbi:hypothetical protein GCM10009716_12930 [Streptomyces sodiiphilus]|uniref:PDZ domain-containing protein n=2 Tax=Streptomyces sodiiphilus TaxID=226217 RepID=A0ABN2NWH7_9ACTN